MKLEYDPDDRVIVETDVRDIAFITNDATDEEAQRLVACWNACEGISTDNLIDNIPVIDIARRYNKAIRQRDELLTALRYVQKKVEVGEEFGISVINEAILNVDKQ